MIFANDRHMRVVAGQRERVKVNKQGEKCRRAGAFFQPLVLEARSGGMFKMLPFYLTGRRTCILDTYPTT
jgi:hypothetical protein